MYKTYLLKIPFYIIAWTIAIGFFTFLREFGQEVIKDYQPLGIYEQIVVHLILGTIAGILFGTIQIIFEKFIFKRVSFGISLLLGSLGYLLAIFSLLSFAILVFSGVLNEELNVNLYKEIIFSKEIFSITAYCFVTASLINFISEVLI
jgi:hypothetical protein